MEAYLLSKQGLEFLTNRLKERGYTIIAPKLEDGVIKLEETDRVATGIVDEQDAGYYRTKVKGEGVFTYAKGPDSFKKFLWPPYERLLWIKKDKKKLTINVEEVVERKYAFIGVRACDLVALEVLDRIFYGNSLFVERYAKLRDNMFIVAVNCTKPASTCFCYSMGNGPEVKRGYDLVLTELADDVLIEVGSDKGREIVFDLKKADKKAISEKKSLIESAKRAFVRAIDKEKVRKALSTNYDSPVWREMEELCLACGNCSMVCPTCFCSEVADNFDLVNERAERVRMWDSCFNLEFTYTAGLYLRSSIGSRYRQWFSHKFAYWVEQFGCVGCVGCGRCITWCPVGIDITQVASKLAGGVP